MNCLECKNLEEAFESRLSQYIDACTAAYYRVTTELAAIYEVVGPVNRKIRHTSPYGLGGLSRAPFFWAFISTLDSPPNPTSWSEERSETKFS
jgi:hypothetical protein